MTGTGARGASPTRRTRRAILLASAALLAGSPAVAQEETDLSEALARVTVLDQITIVSRTGESPIDQLASVSRVDREQIERRQASSPGGLFFGVPGITAQSDAKRATSSINVRGLQDFGRVSVIVDGARQNFQRSGHGTQSLFFLDPELIQQVDVIRGPVANTYGSGAIGGVVFFETKDAEDFLRDDETYAVSATGRYESNGKGWTTSAVGAYRINDAVDVVGNIVWRDFGDFKDGGGDRVSGSGFDVLSGLLKSTIRPTEFSTLKLGWSGADNGWTERGGLSDIDVRQNTFTARYNVTDPDQTWLDLNINGSFNGVALDQTFLAPSQQFSSVNGAPIIIPAGAQTNYDLDTLGVDIWNTSRFSTGLVDHELTYGGDWLQDDVVTTSPSGGADVFTPSGKRRVGGAYVQNKLTYDWLEVIGGLRYDSYSLDGTNAQSSGDRLSPRLTVGVTPFDSEALAGLQFYGTYAEGYRSPSVTETLISGLHPNGVVFPFLPNPNLRPETAKTWEAGINYSRDGIFNGNDSLRIKAAYFHNDVQDYIGGVNLSPFVPGSGCRFTPGASRIPICFQYQNFASAEIRGFEFEALYDQGRFFGGLSASIIDGFTEQNGVRADLVTIPSSQVTAQLGMRAYEGRLTFGGEVQHNVPPSGASFADDYTLVNLFANYQASENVRLDFRVDNLFDVKYANPLNASTTTTVFEPGLSVKVGATVRWGG
ncbi:TonB-dependent hemoglobin/transferrin/lactoferrin family receptor [Mesorhizobium sp. YIM 152430]|uniref:TonB-dependent hemoglobin/transferrin/lactoferrin family receptor n=1 Tax=Mesorhizobium sp. YIM 152430 TaxID=3031761 RepID=UPI0023DBBB30|nr:TonB-dependent hemoglobin/transferrin/lactoferrin family receptor [Mesorhizobium sp. YIM 152430]MDF1599788.1 TonB-dependent hemoglobin/transferrin/lactoferrin family receptor [Mesorhizobium sp. YIM 152430]